MPGAYRYSATFDKPYVEEASPPPRSPVRFSIGSWRGSNAPPPNDNEDGVTDVDGPLLRTAADFSESVSPGENPPLNGSYRDNARTASTDSLDSASCGSVSGSSASSSSGGSGGHSRQVSMEGSDFISSRLSTGKMPVAAVSHNPLQFVKVGPVPLYKKAEEQIKIAKEKKISRETIKENEEQWQSNLDSWKNRRRKMSEKSLQRLEEMKKIEEQEKNAKVNNAKYKTFSEMMEERAQKPRSYNLAIYVNNSEEDLHQTDNGSSTEIRHETNSKPKTRSTDGSVDSENNESDFLNSSFRELENHSNGTDRKIIPENSRNILSSERCQKGSKKIDYPEGCGASVDDGFAEEEGNAYGIYTGDSGLESFGSSHRVGDLADSSSELSTDSGSVYDRPGTEDENNANIPSRQLTTGTDLLEEFSSIKRTKSWPSSLEQKEGFIQRSMRINVNPQCKEKDFGFTVKVEKNADGECTAMVDTVKTGSLSHQAGLRQTDEILAVNGEPAPGRSHSSLMFLVKQSVYRGHLDLVISRPEKDDEEEKLEYERSRPRSHVGPAQRRLLNNRSFDDSWQFRSNSENGFRSRSKSETYRSISSSWSEREKSASLDERFPVDNDSNRLAETLKPNDKSVTQKAVVKKVPPPIPAKPKFSASLLKRPELEPKPITRESLENLSALPAVQLKTAESVSSVSDLDNSGSNFSVDKSNILDDTIQSENEDSASHSVTPLLRTLSDGLRESTDSPQFVSKRDSDACFSDFNESEQDTEKESNQDSSVRSAQSWDRDQLINEMRNSDVTLVEDEIIKVNVGNENDFLQQSSNGEFSLGDDRCCIPLNPLYRDNDGFNIVYQSHDELSPTQYPQSSFRELALEDLQNGVNESRIKEDQDQGLQEVREDIVRVRVDVQNEVFYENVFQEEIEGQPLSTEEEIDPSSQLRDEKTEGQSFCIDETMLADLDSVPTLCLPPTEKPPPPPSTDGESPDKMEGSEVVKRNNTFKRIKKEIWKRRSDFLGIDPSTDEIDIDVPPPPDISEILKSERELARQSKLFLERERAMIHDKLGHMHNLNGDAGRREIASNLGSDDKAKRHYITDFDDQELVSAESTKFSAKMDDEERIKRLQDERRRMSEERILREEERISMEEERMFREREEKLRLKEKALHMERERLRLEQEALQREREEYRRQIELEQQRCYSSASSSEKSLSPPREREAAIWASKQPQGVESTDMSDIDFDEVVLRKKPHDDIQRQDSSPTSSQPLNKDTLHFLGAAPKAKIIQNEQWINRNEKQVAKRRSEPAMHREGGYNQNHWLLHEAEMRRISEQNERQRLQQSPDRRHSSACNIVPQYKSTETNGVSALPSTRRDAFHRLPSTAPRPYQRPAAPPMPPPKPSHVAPYEKEQWNYQPVPTAPVNSASKNLERPRKQLSPAHEYRNYPDGSFPNQRNVVPQPIEADSQQQEQFLSVSGKERCSHCGEFLGHGGAMIIESLQLCYHMHCFCCCVCQAQLGNGMCGTDVRVRNNKLHCQNCYSNDEAGLKFSQV